MLVVSNLSKHYRKKQVLDAVDFKVEANEIIGLVGENGAGKTTLLKILATAMQATSGRVTYDGLQLATHAKALRRRIGYVPQEIAVWEDFSVKENMLFFEKLAWKRHSEAACRKLCLEMKLTQWDEKVETLSGGMKRKLNLAISLLNDPDLLLLDEPTVGIDLKSKKEIAAYLKAYVEKTGKILIYTSHDMDEIVSLCDRVLIVGEDPFYRDILQKEAVAVELLTK